MADELQSPGEGQQGQAEGTAPDSPSPATGQAEPGTTLDQGQAPTGTPVTSEEPSFFDLNLLTPEQREALTPAYKQMQGAFTRKTQEIAAHRQKITEYDQFMADPVGNMQRMALQMGYSLTRAQAQDALNQQGQGQPEADWQPSTWGEVLLKAKEEARREIMEELKPVLGNVQAMRAESIEKQLDSIDSNWRVYEDEMRKNLQLAPALVNDPVKLYKFSVPDEVLEARATQKALARFETKSKAAAVAGKTETSRGIPADEKVIDFDSAVAAARRKLSERR